MSQTIEFNNMQTSDFAFDEAVKTLRTNIRFCGRNIRTVLITSATSNEGKSSITFALASSLAGSGRRTLIIDADIRKSVFAARYRLNQEVFGLSQYLSGQKALEEVLYGTNVENLDIIFSGPHSPSPAELLEDPAFGRMLQWAKEAYDYIIIDTPPLSNVIDAAIIARECDGAALVVESGVLSYQMAHRVKLQLEKSGCRILGVVLNKVGEANSGYYSKYKYYGNKEGGLLNVR